MGLSIPLEQFSFHYPHERAVSIEIQPELGDDASRWRFWQFRPTEEHLLALCAEHRGPDLPRVTIRKVVPLISDAILELPLLKASAHSSLGSK
jgi:4'-phosphopantetheinyl transferase